MIANAITAIVTTNLLVISNTSICNKKQKKNNFNYWAYELLRPGRVRFFRPLNHIINKHMVW